MKVLVAGGFGFVGARIAQALHEAGYEAMIGSRVRRSAPTWLAQSRVRQMDWESITALQTACTGLDAIVHAAGMNAPDCAADPSAALETNGVGTARLVEAAIHAGVQRFFYFSTAHVYASPLQGEIDETCCPGNMHPYATSHLAGEYTLLHKRSAGRIAGTAMRLSNGFGVPISPETDCWSLLTNDLCRQAVTSGKLVLQSSGDQRRDFVSLSTVCTTILALLAQPADALPPVLNIGSGEALKVIEMATLIQQRCQVTLGFTPAIEIGTRKEQSLPLHYSSVHAKRLALPATDPVSEIDALLAFCKTHFSSAPK